MNTISNLTVTDLAQAYQLEKLSHLIPWSEKTFYSNQGERYINSKLVIDNKIIGFSICQRIADEATLFNIAIDPKWRNQGLATTLLNNLIKQLSLLDVVTLWLEVRASNHTAIKLYQRLGFNEITIRKHYYPTLTHEKEDAIIMAYSLTF